MVKPCLVAFQTGHNLPQARHSAQLAVQQAIKCRFVVMAAHHRVACADTASHFPFCFAQESV